MSDAADIPIQAAEAAQYTIWDPYLKKNVYAPQGLAVYIQQNPSHFQNYSGAITHVQNTPVTVGSVAGTAPKADYTTKHAAATGAAALNPGSNDPRAGLNEVTKDVAETVRIIPGAEPDIGVLPDGTVISLIDFRPKQVDPVTQKFAQLALKMPGVPTYAQVRDQIDLNGRGYQFKGDASPEEQALQARFLAGDMKAANDLAKMRMSRLTVNPKPGIDQIMKALTMAAISTGFGAMGGAAFAPLFGGPGLASGALGGAASGGITNTVFSGGDPRAALLGAVGGGVGGSVAPLAGQALGGLGSVPGGALAGAAQGAASAGVKGGLTAALGGDVNPWDVLMGALVGGATGGVGAGLQALDTDPDALTRFLQSVATKGTGAALSQLVGGLLPEGHTGFAPERPGSPFPNAETQKAMSDAQLQAQREALEAARAELMGRLEEYQRRRGEALSARDAKIAEYKQKQMEALARLRSQAAAYLEQARSALQAPLPPVPPLQVPAPPPPPDPFDPSAALGGQTFGGDFPTSRQTTDFPISQEGQLAQQTSSAVPKTKASTQRIPLNLMQIQAALARRRT